MAFWGAADPQGRGQASESPYHRPERLRLVLEQFHEVWDEPYQDADTALSP